MNRPALVDPRMPAKLAAVGFFPSLVTMQSNAATPDAFGAPQPAWSDVTGLVNLPCAIARATMPRSSESQEADFVQDIVTHEITINGAYPAILPKMNAVISATVYRILFVWVDSQSRTTVLHVKQTIT